VNRRRDDGAVTPRLHFFGGKGGVGKTTCAAAAAVAAADSGRRVGIVSTDPAHSLGDAVGCRLGPGPRRVPTRAGSLEAVELDADRALARWLTRRRATLRMVAERGTYLDDEDLEQLLRLSFPGVDELMALVELARLADRARWELVVVDTAPTGHALRMLEMPRTLRQIAGVLDDLHAKHRYLTERFGHGYRAGAAERLIEELDADGRRLTALLRDPARSAFTWLMLPERLALEEARDGTAALAAAGIRVSGLVVNRVAPMPVGSCARCEGRRAEEARVLAAARRTFSAIPLRELPEQEREPRGVQALRAVGRLLDEGVVPSRARRRARRGASRPAVPDRPRTSRSSPTPNGAREAADWLDRVAPADVRLLVFAGKGGVGKTTCAAAAAMTMARRRPAAPVLLLSADPAHSLSDVLGVALGDDERAVPGAPAALRARELDADGALDRTRERYRRAVAATFDALVGGSRFDIAYDRQALYGLMDLAPPGLDELFAVLAIVEALRERRPPYGVVVLDTAPTGHALRLLEMPATALAWVHALLAILLKYRQAVGLGEVATELLATARRLRELRALLADPGRARVIVVTRAAELPQRETERLLARLQRLRLAVPAVLANALISGGCRRCRDAQRGQTRTLAALRPWGIILTRALAPPPRGVAGLERWARTWEFEE
jgi:arsenite/tail-anchored protein-transporting ATPase